MTPPPLLELRGVEAGYGAITALSGVSLTVGQGEIVTLIGANGAGKSTALMSISGVLPARAGEILLDGQPIHRRTPGDIVRRGVVQVPEGRRIFPRLSVAENLEMGAFCRSDPAGVRRDRDAVHTLFPVLAERGRQPGGTLSGGEQQMLAIGRALLAGPRLLLLDEPSLGLAPLVVRQIFEIIVRMNRERGTTILLVEQNAHLALQTAHRGYVLENGRVVIEGTGADLLDNPAVRSAYLGSDSIFSVEHVAQDRAQAGHLIGFCQDTAETVFAVAAHHRVVGIAAGDDRLDGRVQRAQQLQRLRPPHPPGDRQVKDDGVERAPHLDRAAVGVHRRGAVGGGLGLVAQGAEHAPEHFTHERLVVHDEHPSLPRGDRDGGGRGGFGWPGRPGSES